MKHLAIILALAVLLPSVAAAQTRTNNPNNPPISPTQDRLNCGKGGTSAWCR